MTVLEPIVVTADIACDAATPVSLRRRKSMTPGVLDAFAPVITHWSLASVDDVANEALMTSVDTMPVTPVQYAYCVVVPTLALLAIIEHEVTTWFTWAVDVVPSLKLAVMPFTTEPKIQGLLTVVTLAAVVAPALGEDAGWLTTCKIALPTRTRTPPMMLATNILK